jgi:hypothetical protein
MAVHKDQPGKPGGCFGDGEDQAFLPTVNSAWGGFVFLPVGVKTIPMVYYLLKKCAIG